MVIFLCTVLHAPVTRLASIVSFTASAFVIMLENYMATTSCGFIEKYNVFNLVWVLSLVISDMFVACV